MKSIFGMLASHTSNGNESLQQFPAKAQIFFYGKSTVLNVLKGTAGFGSREATLN